MSFVPQKKSVRCPAEMDGKEISFISNFLRLVLDKVLGLDKDFTDRKSGSEKGNKRTYPLQDISFRFLKCSETG
jgi:hypothetical protein